jgi:hypothetical protein
MKFRHEAIHHRKPSSLGGGNESRNITRVNRKQHMAWHRLFQNWTPEDIAEVINDMWLDPNYKMEVRRIR